MIIDIHQRMQHSDRQYYCVAWYFLWHADLFRCRVACNHHDEETTESDGNNIQDDIESQAVFRILKSNLKFRAFEIPG